MVLFVFIQHLLDFSAYFIALTAYSAQRLPKEDIQQLIHSMQKPSSIFSIDDAIINYKINVFVADLVRCALNSPIFTVCSAQKFPLNKFEQVQQQQQQQQAWSAPSLY